jgi:hypothetical protein
VALIAGAFVVVLGLVTGGVLAFLAYDKSTKIDRSTPQVVTVQFLQAALVERSAERVGLFVCDTWSISDAMARASSPTTQPSSASWNDLVASVHGATATTVVDVQFVVSSGGSLVRLSQRWTMELADQNGWRVCSLSVASLNP